MKRYRERKKASQDNILIWAGRSNAAKQRGPKEGRGEEERRSCKEEV